MAPATVATEFPALNGCSLTSPLGSRGSRTGVLIAIENIANLDASFWRHFSDPDVSDRDVADRIASGELRPDWTKRGFLRGYTDRRYSFGRHFSPLEPNRPANVDELFGANDVVLCDREADPAEMINQAGDPSHQTLVAEYSAELEALISAEIGDDRRSWVTERPNLLGWPTWKGDAREAGAA